LEHIKKIYRRIIAPFKHWTVQGAVAIYLLYLGFDLLLTFADFSTILKGATLIGSSILVAGNAALDEWKKKNGIE